jgi:ABC-type transporter Mla subunit MlaD
MLQENLQINIGANTQDLQAGLNQATNSVNNFSTAVQKAAKPTSDATNTLSNLSRVAQDAPYGFIGIANNLNPLLESFQRLQKESGGTGNALKSMAAGLMGPAGIGLALGAVSSLFIAFGDDIMNFVNQTGEFEKAQKSMRDGFAENAKSAEETIVKDKALLSVINDTAQSTEARVAALKKLKEEYKGNIELQKTDITDGAILEEILRKISNALLRKAEIESIVKVIGEEYSKQLRAQISTSEEQVKNLSIVTKTWDALKSVVTSGGIGSAVINTYDKLTKTDGLNKSKEDIKGYGEAIAKLQSILDKKTGEAFKAGDYSATSKGEKAGADDQFTKGLKAFNSALAAEDTLLKNNLESTQQNLDNKIKIYEDFIKKLGGINNEQAKSKIAELMTPLTEMQMTKFEDRIKAAGKFIDNQKPEVIADPVEKGGSNKVLLNALTGETGEKQSDKSFALGKKDMDNFFKDNKKKFDDAEKAAKSYADTISKSVTGGLMNMWDAMEKGESPLQALSNMFKDLLKQLIAAVAQALIFQAIMSMLNPAGAAAGGASGGMGGGLLGGIGKIFGFAEGGIVSQPTMAMVGEGGQSEAIMPLNKLGNMMNSTFNAGAMSGSGGGGGGQFTLKGNDLVLAMQRSNFSLNVRR